MKTVEKYKMKDLSIGMEVCPDQLSDILNMYFIIAYDSDDNETGHLVFMGKTQNDEYNSWFMQSKPITPIYNRKEDMDDMVVYDE